VDAVTDDPLALEDQDAVAELADATVTGGAEHGTVERTTAGVDGVGRKSAG
jgi:hypothetical protein